MKKLLERFREWRIERQSAKFAKELKEKKYKPFKKWDIGIWILLLFLGCDDRIKEPDEASVIVKIKELIEKQILNLDIKFNLIFIDDGSLDNSVEIIKSLNSESKNINITLLQLDFNMGHQKAIYQGLLEVEKSDYDNVIIMDSDGEDDPAAIPQMIKCRHFDLVNIVRGKRSESLFFRMNYLIYKR